MAQLKKDIKNISLKDFVSYSTCVLAFLVGFGLCIAGFIVDPLGKVDDSNLYILGEALAYAASILGIATYAHKSVQRMRHELGLKHEEEECD